MAKLRLCTDASKRDSGIHMLFTILRMRTAFAFGYAVIGVVIIAAVLAPLIAPYSPIQANPARFLEPPSWDHWMGTGCG